MVARLARLSSHRSGAGEIRQPAAPSLPMGGGARLVSPSRERTLGRLAGAGPRPREWSVDLSGDTLVVGAPFEDSSTTGVGGMETDNGAHDSDECRTPGRNTPTSKHPTAATATTSDGSSTPGATPSSSPPPGRTAAAQACRATPSTTAPANPGRSTCSIVAPAAGLTPQPSSLKPHDTFTNDFFGFSVALSATGLAVGSPYENSPAHGVNGDAFATGLYDSGAVYFIE